MPPVIHRLDANESIWFQRELESIEREVYKIIYAEFMAKSAIPVAKVAPIGAGSTTYRQTDMVGRAKIVANSANDYPEVGLKGEEFSVMIKELGAKYSYTLRDLEAVNFGKSGMSLDMDLASAARFAIERELDYIGWFGNAEANVKGFLYNPDIPTSTPADGATGSSTLWSTKTPAEILLDMNTLVQGIDTLTKGAESPDTLLLPSAQYGIIATTRVSTAENMTILKSFLANSPYIKEVMKVPILADLPTAIPTTGDSDDIMVAYRKHPEVLKFAIPLPFTQLKGNWVDSMNYSRLCRARTAGVIVYKPKACSILVGI